MLTTSYGRLKAKLSLAAAQAASTPIPPPARRAVSGFPAHTDAVEGLPLLERIQLRLLVDWVIETHMPGAFPVTAITCIGHADRDYQRGQAYEIDISQRRGRAVLKYLENDISRFSFSFSPTSGISTINSAIRFTASGVGSKFAKPATNETQRLRNRRVEIIFDRGSPKQAAQPHLKYEDLFKGILKGCPGCLPWPKPNYFMDVKYPTRDEWKEIIKFIRNSPLKFIDLKFVAEGLIEALEPPKNDEEAIEKWVEGLTDAILDDERERRNRTLDPPGDPDEPDDETEAPPTKYDHLKPVYQQS